MYMAADKNEHFGGIDIGNKRNNAENSLLH